MTIIKLNLFNFSSAKWTLIFLCTNYKLLYARLTKNVIILGTTIEYCKAFNLLITYWTVIAKFNLTLLHHF